MFSNSRGFFLVEILLSLSIWLIIAGGLVPIYIHLTRQSISIEQEMEATHLLYEVLTTSIIKGEVVGDELIERGNFEFAVDWQGEGKSSEVCIIFETPFRKQITKCEQIE